MNQVLQINNVLSGKTHPGEFTDVQHWLGQCFNEPTLNEQKMCAFNQILFGFGIEAEYGKWQNGYWGNVVFTYVNMGFGDVPTIIEHRDKGFLYLCVDDMIRTNYKQSNN